MVRNWIGSVAPIDKNVEQLVVIIFVGVPQGDARHGKLND